MTMTEAGAPFAECPAPADALMPEGIGLSWYKAIDSTNEEAKRRAERGETGPCWIVAESQTAGRGRRGRAWVSPSGNFAGTFVFPPKASAARAADLCFATALAVYDAVALLTPESKGRLSLKWPNDLLLDRAKTSGILLESSSSGASDLAWIAIGIGVNLEEHPLDTPYPCTDLRESIGVSWSQGQFLTALAPRLAHWVDVWRADGFAGLRETWLNRAAGLGQGIVVRLSNEEIEGRFEGLTERGELELRDAQGRLRLIGAGDVFF